LKIKDAAGTAEGLVEDWDNDSSLTTGLTEFDHPI
jgi:hypothetical protein